MPKAKSFKVDYSHGETSGCLIVAAEDVRQALVAAQVRLKLQRMNNFVINNIRTSDELSFPRGDADALYSIRLIADISHAGLNASDGPSPREELVFVYSCLALIDNGYSLPPELRSDFDMRYPGSSLWKWNVDVFDEDRLPITLAEASENIAYAFIDRWCEAPSPYDSYDGTPRDPDIGVDFQNNVPAYCFLLATRALVASSATPDELLLARYERVLPRFLDANDLLGLDQIDFPKATQENPDRDVDERRF